DARLPSLHVAVARLGRAPERRVQRRQQQGEEVGRARRERRTTGSALEHRMNRRAEIALTAEQQSASLRSDVLRERPAKRVAIRVSPERVASWDPSTLRGAY